MPRSPRTLTGAFLIAIVSITCPLALAQDDPPSPIEVQLRREIATLRDRLAGAEERIKRLEAERDALLKQLADARAAAAGTPSSEAAGQDPGPTEPRAEIPGDPFASPASMLKELQKRYEAEFSRLPHDTDPAIEDYKKDVQEWSKSGLRDMRDRRQWLVKVTDLTPDPNDRRSYDATVRVIDEASGLPIGDPFKSKIDTANARKIEAGKDRFAYWRATVVLAPAPIYNEQRIDAGVFEHPPFVGRYCDFGIEIDWRLFQGVRAEEVEKTKPEQPAGR